MSKPHQIRKKAMEFAKKRQWDKAVGEYTRLAELEANNPNVFNELGDLHLKTDNKSQAFKAFHTAIDAYAAMGLYNNSVAVCKKIIRLNPSDRDVYRKLAGLRGKQGLDKEAVTYAATYLDNITGETSLNAEQLKGDLIELAESLDGVPEILKRVADCLISGGFVEEGGQTLEKLAAAYAAMGLQEEVSKVVQKMDELGYVASEPIPDVAESQPGVFVEPDTDDFGRSGAAEDFGAPSIPEGGEHFDFDSVELGGVPGTESATATGTDEAPEAGASTDDSQGFVTATTFDPKPSAVDTEPGEGADPQVVNDPPDATDGAPDAPPDSEDRVYDIPAEDPPGSEDGVYDIPAEDPPDSEDGEDDIPGEDPPDSEEVVDDIPAEDSLGADDPTDSAPKDLPTTESVESTESVDGVPQGDGNDEDPSNEETPHGPTEPVGDGEVWIPEEEMPSGVDNRKDGDGGVVQMSDLVNHFDAAVKSDVDADDYRSHYDLGMAYIEMDLITEAIREFQFAAQSSMYRARSLELIGLCFIKQNQPRLAIKQLEKGLSLVGDDDRDAIGLRYNLGVAYEMIGQKDKAKYCFEEVYVLDVAFRDIAEKIKDYSS